LTIKEEGKVLHAVTGYGGVEVYLYSLTTELDFEVSVQLYPSAATTPAQNSWYSLGR
jgi:hypothetical protein